MRDFGLPMLGMGNLRNAENNLRNEICGMKMIGWRAWSRDQPDSANYCLPSKLDVVVICGMYGAELL